MAQLPPPVLNPNRRDPIRPVQVGKAAAAAQPISWSDPSQRTPLLILAGLAVLLVLAYWDMFLLTSTAWSDPLYSHGWLVPIGAVVLLWLRRRPFEVVPPVERWIGLGLLAFGLLARLVAAEYGISPLDQISFMPAIFGAFMLVGGMRTLEWAWPGLAVLVFMFPMPNRYEGPILGELQDWASVGSERLLQTLGVPAFREGNVISIQGMDQPLNIAEACAGLRMATIFGAMAVVMIFIVERPWWDKLVIVISAIPIALAVNIIRITLTGLLYMMVGQENHFAQKLGHDWAGYFMMPMALGFLWLELQILERVTVPVDSVQLKPVGAARGVAIPARSTVTGR